MSTFEMYRVCQNCFKKTSTNNPPILEKYHYRDMKCKSCSLPWIGVNVGYYPPKKRWYEIRPKNFSSGHSLCRQKISGLCKRDWKCRWAHNPLELEIWIKEEQELKNRKIPNQFKLGCIICHKDCKDSNSLKDHLMGNEHHTKTFNMWILPNVGSSIEYTGPIRARPKLPYGKNSYELCRTFARSGRCQYSAGCKHAHSDEELRVWMDALTARMHERHDQRYSHSGSQKGHSSSRSHSSSSQDGDGRYSSESSESHSQGTYSSRKPPSPITDNVGEKPDHVKEVYSRIRDFGIEPCLRNFPKHIQIICSRSLTITVEEKNKTDELKWVFGLKTTQPEYLSLIVLYDHKNMFSLGEIAKCSTEGAGRNDLKLPYVPNRTSYLVQQAFNLESYFEVELLCKHEVGAYRMQIIFQITGDVLVGREVKVKTQGEGFKDKMDNFRQATKRETVKSVMSENLLKVNWEHSFELLNSNMKTQNYPLPIDIEDKIKDGAYDNVRDGQVNKETYKLRFHTLLHLEEFEHKRSLMKYDLQNEKITFHNVHKQISIENYFGRDYVRNAQRDTQFITFKLNQRLFEGYQSFRPPKLVYIIPNGTKKAFEFKVYHTGSDYVIVSITTKVIEACQHSGGLALVRFTPEREDYSKMHEALDAVTFPVLFPVHRKIQIPRYWDIDHLLGRLQYENTLSEQQKIAVYSIINSKFQSFPTLICGPFGCGKTRTLMVAARLITGAFYDSNVLIVTKTNSSANIYVELLQDNFDTIKMLREKRARKKIMFRHFGMSRNIHLDKTVTEFANIEDGVYKDIHFFELQKCSIVVTTLLALNSLVPPRARENSKSVFSHIFIDEAAQLTEPEACIALSLAGASTKIALAGDIHQSRPLVLSKYGKKYNLDQSLLERLEMLPEYETEPLNKCKVNLVENFRSQHTIVEFLSELFYENSLIANPPSLIGPVNFPALSFLHVSGEEQSLHGFPSYYNQEEAELTMKALRKFVAGGVTVDRIAVLTRYKAQVRLIQELLKAEGIVCTSEEYLKSNDHYCIENNCINDRTIEVRNSEGIQGREYDLIVINTVRTVSDVPDDLSLEERLDLGLLDDVTQFNTILAGARGWVLVIGDSDCLTRVGECSNVWSKYIQACQQVNGLFGTYREFEASRMQIGNTKETKVPNLKTSKIEEIPKSKISHSLEPQLEVPTTKNTDDSKYTLLHSFINTCYQELTISTNQEVKEAINEQLAHANVAVEAVENQRYIEQKCILSNYQAGDMLQKIDGNPCLGQIPTQEQLFPKGLLK